MKIDEVQGTPGVPASRSQDVARQQDVQKQAVRNLPPPDQVDISAAAKKGQTADPAVRAAQLRADLQKGTHINASALASKILKDGAVG